MGAAASLNDFGPFGDIHAVKSFCGEDFDQAKFDELKDEDGFITKEILEELMATRKEVATQGESSAAAEEEQQQWEPGPVTVPLTALQATMAAAVERGLTPLVLDSSPEHMADAFFGYNAIMVDAKQISLDCAKVKMAKGDVGKAQAAGLEKARKGLVAALQNGSTLVVSMQQGSPSFNEWFDTPSEWPVLALATKAGIPLTVQGEDKEFGGGVVKAVMRDADTAHHSGFAICNPKFNVVFTSWFEPEDFEEFLFEKGKGLEKLSKDLFQFIIIQKEGE